MRKGVVAVVGAIALAGMFFYLGHEILPEDTEGRIEPFEGGLMAVGMAALTLVAMAVALCVFSAVYEWIERGDDS